MVINPLVMEYEWLVGALEHEWIIFHNKYMGCHPNPIDKLHHFSTL
jgi:hypothetical protein